MKRPSSYVLLCAVVVLVTFSASGHLALGEPAAKLRSHVAVKLEHAARPVPTQPITGSVLDTMGFLVVGAEVQCGDSKGRTDANGRFQFDVRPAPVADLLVAAAGYRPALLHSSPSAREPLLVALEPLAPWDPPIATAAASNAAAAAAVVGEGFVHGEDGKPVVGALVIAVETGALARTDDVGHYAIALPAAGATLVVHDPDGGPTGNGLCVRSERLTPGRSQGAVPLPPLIAHPGGAIRGTVRGADGVPQRGVSLQIAGEGLVRTVASGESGSFRVGGLQPGRYELRPFAFRGAFGESCAVDLNAPLVECELRLHCARERRLQVVTEAGAPVGLAVVETRVGGLRRGVDRADNEGWVQMRAATPAAQFEVRSGDDFKPMRVVGPPAADRLVVALP